MIGALMHPSNAAGKINLSSPDHISLLVHRTFNVSIPRYHITTDSYEFEYGPAENDPEFGAGGAAASATENITANAEGAEGAEGQSESAGRWVHKLTETKLGDADGYLEFTVVGFVSQLIFRFLSAHRASLA